MHCTPCCRIIIKTPDNLSKVCPARNWNSKKFSTLLPAIQVTLVAKHLPNDCSGTQVVNWVLNHLPNNWTGCYTPCRSRPYIRRPTRVCSATDSLHSVTFGIAQNGAPQSELGLWWFLYYFIYSFVFTWLPDTSFWLLPHVHLMASRILP